MDTLQKENTSLTSLIIWNISKALEKKATLDLKVALKEAQVRLDHEARDVTTTVAASSEGRHLLCALLAWHQLGHKDTDSLYEFIETNRHRTTLSNNSWNQSLNKESVCADSLCVSSKSKDCAYLNTCKGVNSASFDTHSLIGPVVKLPAEPRIVMRVENTPCARHSAKRTQKTPKSDIMKKLDTACCMDSVCTERLKELDIATTDLRTRAEKLARREAERAELLERAEAAWRDLELGYQRRLGMAMEKEEDITKQMQKKIEERNSYKSFCTTLIQQLKEKTEVAEKKRAQLYQVEQEICERACERVRLSEVSARGDAAVAEHQCRALQLDRDLQFKEDQARRRVLALESEVDTARALTLEAERAMRAELAALKEQISQVSKDLIQEDAENKSIMEELEEFRHEKMGMVEDLDGCKLMCDGRMQGRMDELMTKRDELEALKEKVIECQCKLPHDESVEVKRTPSLAALCKCTPEEKILESCSCTSLRSQLLSNLLSDLFGGLQAELGGSGSLMPCQLLKCLEDRHNWDRDSITKSNLRSFFARLLVGELDIAIATSIEKYHARWVGASCADAICTIPVPGTDSSPGWQQRAIESRAQKLAEKLADQLFKEKAAQLTKKAKEIVSAGPPPCKCKPSQDTAAVFPCLVKAPAYHNNSKKSVDKNGPLQKAFQDVTLLRAEIDNLRKETVKKEDLKEMENKITKILQSSTGIDSCDAKPNQDKKIKRTVNNKLSTKSTRTETTNIINSDFKANVLKQKKLGTRILDLANNRIEKKTGTAFKKVGGHSYAVNVCLCDTNKGSNKTRQNTLKSWKRTASKDMISQISSIKQTKPIISVKSQDIIDKEKNVAERLCSNNCVCFHKIPSNTSIDKLLEELIKWNNNLLQSANDVCKKSGGKHSDVAKNVKNINSSAIDCYTSPVKTTVKSSEADRDPPTETISEYMGAVNLNKSNNVLCKCVLSKHKSIGSVSDKSQIKCINSCSCTVEYESKEKNTKTQISEVNEISKENNSQKENNNNANAEKAVFLKKYSFNNTYDCDCDYDIKFLGVTLTNIDNGKTVENSFKNAPNSKILSDDGKSSNFSRKENLFNKENKCNCKYDVFAEKSNYGNINIVNNVENQYKDTQEECVCCNNINENCLDLETNAFNLLEEHLKSKLKELKKMSCNASCMSSNESEKICTSIIDKVKELISEYTNTIACNCVNPSQNRTSWSRAYSLLQEYLKLKMKRVQCCCIPNKEGSELMLPSVLNKVCNLIESDFQRIREICKCKTSVNKNQFVLETDNNCIADVYCGRPVNAVYFDNYHSTKEQFDRNNIKLDIFHESLKKIDNIELASKSCDVMEKDSVDVQTSDTAKIATSCKSCSPHITNNDCSCQHDVNHMCLPIMVSKNNMVNQWLNIPTKQSNEYLKDYVTCSAVNTSQTDIRNVRLTSLLKEKETEVSTYQLKTVIKKEMSQPNLSPYIGYTLNCNDYLLSCTCAKSMAHICSDKINEIWNAEAFNKNKLQNMSYIMHKVKQPQQSSLIENYCDTVDKNSISNRESKTRNMEIITDNFEEDMILKESTSHITKAHNTTSSFDDCISTHTENSMNDFTLDWYDCRSVTHNKKTTDIFINNKEFSDSFYYPGFTKIPENDNVLNSEINFLRTVSENCNCKLVPICHVKMLVKNIEHKLMECKCTCDSMCPEVCPIHFQ